MQAATTEESFSLLPSTPRALFASVGNSESKPRKVSNAVFTSSQCNGRGLCRYSAGRTAVACITLIASLVSVSTEPPLAAERPRSDLRALNLRFLGGDKQVPSVNAELVILNGHGSSQKRFGPFPLDADGVCTVNLAPGPYHLQLTSEKELPYLSVEVLWNNLNGVAEPDLNLLVTNLGAEKWLRGKRRDDGYERSVEPNGAPRITYRLLPATELVLRAVDAQTGNGLAGVQFYEENAFGEEWGHPIDGENIRAKRPSRKKTLADAGLYSTDKDGYFRRLIGAKSGYTYGVAKVPPGYQRIDTPREVAIDVKYGQKRAEYVSRKWMSILHRCSATPCIGAHAKIAMGPRAFGWATRVSQASVHFWHASTETHSAANVTFEGASCKCASPCHQALQLLVRMF